MSHTTGHVEIDGEIVGWFEYDGTSDLLTPWIYKTAKLVADNWRRRDPYPRCHCESCHHVDVKLQTNYGGGQVIESSMCKVCSIIVGPLSQDEYDEEY